MSRLELFEGSLHYSCPDRPRASRANSRRSARANQSASTHYFANGGKEEEIKAALTSEPLNRISAKVQTDQQAAQAAANECSPTFHNLMR